MPRNTKNKKQQQQQKKVEDKWTEPIIQVPGDEKDPKDPKGNYWDLLKLSE